MPDESRDWVQKWNKDEGVFKTDGAFEEEVKEEKEGEQKQLMDTGITIHGERLLLETNSQETLDKFRLTYRRLERHFLGDYGE